MNCQVGTPLWQDSIMLVPTPFGWTSISVLGLWLDHQQYISPPQSQDLIQMFSSNIWLILWFCGGYLCWSLLFLMIETPHSYPWLTDLIFNGRVPLVLQFWSGQNQNICFALTARNDAYLKATVWFKSLGALTGFQWIMLIIEQIAWLWLSFDILKLKLLDLCNFQDKTRPRLMSENGLIYDHPLWRSVSLNYSNVQFAHLSAANVDNSDSNAILMFY